MSSDDRDFHPLPWCDSGHTQTIVASLVAFDFAPSSSRLIVELPDKDKITLEITTPPQWKKTDPTVILVHGLCGSHKASNVVRLAKRLSKLGVRSARLNLRGCGSGKGMAKQFYHCGSSQDVMAGVQALKKMSPQSPISLVGYSLGANIVLKLAGELGAEGKNYLSQVVAISPPADLKSSVHMLQMGANQFYQKHFVRLLLKDVKDRYKKFPELPRINFHPNLSLFEFDEYYIAPSLGYSCAYEYYEACSAKRFVPNIDIPCNVLFAKDDPIINPDCLDNVHVPSHVNVYKTECGGHLGFLAHPKEGFRWMDNLIITWLTTGQESKKVA